MSYTDKNLATDGELSLLYLPFDQAVAVAMLLPESRFCEAQKT